MPVKGAFNFSDISIAFMYIQFREMCRTTIPDREAQRRSGGAYVIRGLHVYSGQTGKPVFEDKEKFALHASLSSIIQIARID